jgi:hypothetical protein
MPNKLITWFKKLFVKEKPVKKYKFPVPKGYVVYTDEGGKFNCTSQKIVAETLSALYNININRDHVHHALSRYNGKLVYNKVYIATINYRKESK